MKLKLLINVYFQLICTVNIKMVSMFVLYCLVNFFLKEIFFRLNVVEKLKEMLSFIFAAKKTHVNGKTSLLVIMPESVVDKQLQC